VLKSPVVPVADTDRGEGMTKTSTFCDEARPGDPDGHAVKVKMKLLFPAKADAGISREKSSDFTDDGSEPPDTVHLRSMELDDRLQPAGTSKIPYRRSGDEARLVLESGPSMATENETSRIETVMFADAVNPNAFVMLIEMMYVSFGDREADGRTTRADSSLASSTATG
jgi:hypothetical protein